MIGKILKNSGDHPRTLRNPPKEFPPPRPPLKFFISIFLNFACIGLKFTGSLPKTLRNPPNIFLPPLFPPLNFFFKFFLKWQDSTTQRTITDPLQVVLDQKIEFVFPPSPPKKNFFCHFLPKKFENSIKIIKKFVKILKNSGNPHVTLRNLSKEFLPPRPPLNFFFEFFS